ncbi:hypothetical protein FJR06_21930 [Dolichospermum sp. UHCC 0352]|nr:hypothetical protein [Dolichospermum sp. UHCC 0299]MTJ23826.1 hypothetical protein [Dolichospermum sp. UHCC 0352]MTJ40243.1 hypothetical protein [Dolichospermum sp. UHCC 0406]
MLTRFFKLVCKYVIPILYETAQNHEIHKFIRLHLRLSAFICGQLFLKSDSIQLHLNLVLL